MSDLAIGSYNTQKTFQFYEIASPFSGANRLFFYKGEFSPHVVVKRHSLSPVVVFLHLNRELLIEVRSVKCISVKPVYHVSKYFQIQILQCIHEIYGVSLRDPVLCDRH